MVFWPNNTKIPAVYTVQAVAQLTGIKWKIGPVNGGVYSLSVINDELYLFKAGEEPEILVLRSDTGAMVRRYTVPGITTEGVTFSDQAAFYVVEHTYLKALSLQDGTIKWSYQTPKKIRTLPRIVQNTVYFSDRDTNLFSVAAETGELKWVFHAKSEIRSPASVGPDGTVYVGSFDNRLYSLHGDSGEVRWSFRSSGVINSAPVIAYGTVYFGSNDFTLYAVDCETGKEKWRFAGGTWIRTFPVVFANKVYFTCYSERQRLWKQPSCYANELCCLHADTGELEWSKIVPDVFSGPYISDGRIFICGQDGIFRALDVQSGEQKWQFGVEWGWVFDPAFADGRIYIACADKSAPESTYPYIYALDTASADGR